MYKFTITDILKITNKIKDVYNKLFLLELTNKINEDFYKLQEELKNLIYLEDNMYKNLTQEDLNFLDEYISSGFEYNKNLFGTEEGYESESQKEFPTFVNDNYLALIRIEKRLEIENVCRRNNCYSINDHTINGVSLFFKPMDEEVASIFVEEINNAVYYHLLSNYKTPFKKELLDLKYATLFPNSSLEKYIINNDLFINNKTNIEQLLKLSDRHNSNKNYILECNLYYYANIEDTINLIINGMIEDEYLDFYIFQIKAYLLTTFKDYQKNIYRSIKENVKAYPTAYNLKLFGMAQEVCKDKVKTM